MKDGNFNGKGKLIYSDGVVYEGEFLDSDLHGFGKFIYEDGGY